jgi:hypothetical protein
MRRVVRIEQGVLPIDKGWGARIGGMTYVMHDMLSEEGDEGKHQPL